MTVSESLLRPARKMLFGNFALTKSEREALGLSSETVQRIGGNPQHVAFRWLPSTALLTQPHQVVEFRATSLPSN